MNMRAVQFHTYGGPDVLQLVEMAAPTPAAGSVLVRVHATTVNPLDSIVRSGRLRAITRGFPKGVGADFAGVVAGLGTGVSDFEVGEHVWGFLSGFGQIGSGAAADFVVVEENQIASSPTGLGFLQAASLVVGGTTTITALRDKVGLKSGERILIRGAAGGVGSIAVQFASARGAEVTALTSQRTAEWVRGLGARRTHDYHSAKPADLGTFDVVFDTVGTELRSYRRLLAPGGRMVSIAFSSLPQIIYAYASAAFGSRRVRLFSGSPDRALLTDLTTLAESGAIKPVVNQVYSLEEIRSAHRALEAGGGSGGKHVVQLI